MISVLFGVQCSLFAHQVVLDHVDQLASSESFESTINNFDSNFSRHLVDLLDKIMDFRVDNSEHKLNNILHR
jgi:gamma-tubulin complex component 2